MSDAERWAKLRDFLEPDYAATANRWSNASQLGKWPQVQTPGKTNSIVIHK